MKAVVAAFNQEKALVGAFSVIVQPVVEPMDRYTALVVLVSRVTCHVSRAVRIVPSEQPEANLANLYNYPRPPPVVSTSLVTEPVTAVVTVATELTTPLTVTLGAREVLTEIVQPTTTVSILPHDRYTFFFLFV